MQLKDAALKYAQNGYRVLPVWWIENGKCACGQSTCEKANSQGKHPIKAGWQNFASTDETKVSRWWRRWPKANIGIMPPAGTVLLDVDPRNGGSETLDRLRGGKKLPTTVVQKSGGGGMHILYEGDTRFNRKDQPGIDIRKHGSGFVVAWPSMHISGKQYTWQKAPWDAAIAKLPPYLCVGGLKAQESAADAVGAEFDDALSESKEKGGEGKPTADKETIREALMYVDASDRMNWVTVGHALKHAYGDAGRDLWEEWSKTSKTATHRFDENGDIIKWETFHKNEGRKPFTLRSVIMIARRGGYKPLTVEFDRLLWEEGEIQGLARTKPEALEWALRGILPCGRTSVMAGAGGSSKSFLALISAISFALGEDFGPFKPGCDGRVMILTAEDDRSDMHRRLYAICHQLKHNDEQVKRIEENLAIVSVRGLDWRLMAHDDMGDLQETGKPQYLIDEIRMLGDVKLLILDPLVAFNGGNENDNAEMARLMATLDRIAGRTGAAVLVIHHANKASGNTSMDNVGQGIIRGASALVDQARSAMYVMRPSKEDAALFGILREDASRYVVVKFVKNNYGPHVQDAVFAVEQDGVLRHAVEIQRKHANTADAKKAIEFEGMARRILVFMADGKRYSCPEMSNDLGGVASRTVQRYMDDFVTKGYVDTVGPANGGTGRAYLLSKKGFEKLHQYRDKGAGNGAEFEDLV